MILLPRPLLWGAWWIPSPWCIDWITIDVRKVSPTHPLQNLFVYFACVDNRIWNWILRKGFCILYPQRVYIRFSISCTPKKNSRNRPLHLLLAYWLLLSFWSHLEKENEGKKKRLKNKNKTHMTVPCSSAAMMSFAIEGNKENQMQLKDPVTNTCFQITSPLALRFHSRQTGLSF